MLGEVYNLDVDERSALALNRRGNGHHATILSGSGHDIRCKRLKLHAIALLYRNSNIPRLAGFLTLDDP